jgi:hypothetical protein
MAAADFRQKGRPVAMAASMATRSLALALALAALVALTRCAHRASPCRAAHADCESRSAMRAPALSQPLDITKEQERIRAQAPVGSAQTGRRRR